jgi:hypothetical protein
MSRIAASTFSEAIKSLACQSDYVFGGGKRQAVCRIRYTFCSLLLAAYGEPLILCVNDLNTDRNGELVPMRSSGRNSSQGIAHHDAYVGDHAEDRLASAIAARGR